MNDGSWLIWVKVLGLMMAGVAFGWWQLRDVSRSMAKTQQDESGRLDREAERDSASPHA